MKQTIVVSLNQALNTVLNKHEIKLEQPVSIQIEHPRDPTHGDFSTNLAMTLAKTLKMNPRSLAEELIEAYPHNDYLAKIELAGPGFINLTLSPAYYAQALKNYYKSSTLGVTQSSSSTAVVVDYSSPNLAKEMHVGHLRSTIIGDALAKILEFKGLHVIRQNHVGDWGTQFGMLIAHLEDVQTHEHSEVELSNLELFYQAAKKRFDEEPQFAERARQQVVALQSGDAHCLALWTQFIKLSLTHCQETYDQLNVSLTAGDVRAESSYNATLPLIVETLKNLNLLTEHEGAQCVFLDEFKGKDQTPLPIIVQKSDGGYLYATTDLAAVAYRHQQLHAERVLYVVDARQSLHFQQIFALAHRAGFASPEMKLEHVSFGMVLDASGKPFKTREGGVTKLAELIEEAQKRALELLQSRRTDLSHDEQKNIAHVIAIGSIKYADLSKNRNSDYIFDWGSMLSFEGNTAPYLLYANTRILSLLAKSGIELPAAEFHSELQHENELKLAKQLYLFPEIIDQVAEKTAPHLLCGYLYDCAVIFSSFYEACPILNLDNPSLKLSRLYLAQLTSKILTQGLNLLGIQTLNRM